MSTIGAIISTQASVAAGANSAQRVDNPGTQANDVANAIQSGAQAVVVAAESGRPTRATTRGDGKKVDASFQKQRAKSKEKSIDPSAKRTTVNVTA